MSWHPAMFGARVGVGADASVCVGVGVGTGVIAVVGTSDGN